MKNEKVWVGEITFDKVNGFSLGKSFPNVLDYQEVIAVESEVSEKSDLPEYEGSQELAELRKRNFELTDILIELNDAYVDFEKLTVQPDSLWLKHDYDSSLPDPSNYLFTALEGGLVLNESCASVFKQFTLGESILSPVQIHKLFTDELWLDGTFYVLNLCEQRNHLAHPQDSEFMEYETMPPPDKYVYDGCEIEPHEVMVKTSALECDVDLWHDPLFSESYFFSERLAMALIQAGFDEKWSLQPCKMV